MTSRSVAGLAAVLLFAAACGSADPPLADDSDLTGPAVATGAPRPVRPGPQRLRMGDTARIDGDGAAATVTVSGVTVIPPPDGWGPDRMLIATVVCRVAQGVLDYDESAFNLVAPDGSRDSAYRGPSDDGLPGTPLRSGQATAPAQATGLIRFRAPVSPAGYEIELLGPSGVVATWSLSWPPSHSTTATLWSTVDE